MLLQQSRAFERQPIPSFCHVQQLDSVILTLRVARKDTAFMSVLNVFAGLLQG
jgi:hypothetical protein